MLLERRAAGSESVAVDGVTGANGTPDAADDVPFANGMTIADADVSLSSSLLAGSAIAGGMAPSDAAR